MKLALRLIRPCWQHLNIPTELPVTTAAMARMADAIQAYADHITRLSVPRSGYGRSNPGNATNPDWSRNPSAYNPLDHHDHLDQQCHDLSTFCGPTLHLRRACQPPLSITEDVDHGVQQVQTAVSLGFQLFPFNAPNPQQCKDTT